MGNDIVEFQLWTQGMFFFLLEYNYYNASTSMIHNGKRSISKIEELLFKFVYAMDWGAQLAILVPRLFFIQKLCVQV